MSFGEAPERAARRVGLKPSSLLRQLARHGLTPDSARKFSHV